MSPRAADPAVRHALIERAAHLLATRQPVTLRRLASDVGVSTMAVYTHFGGMEQLRREVRIEAFERLAQDLATVHSTKDPVADVLALGWAYCHNAVTNPDLYRIKFLEDVAEAETDVFGAIVGFMPVVAAVERCLESGRLAGASASDIALQLWGLTHGFVTFTLRGVLTVDEMVDQLANASVAMFVGYGDALVDASLSMRRMRRRMQRDRPMGGSLRQEKQPLSDVTKLAPTPGTAPGRAGAAGRPPRSAGRESSAGSAPAVPGRAT